MSSYRDIQLWRQQLARLITLSSDNTSKLLVGQNARRVALIVSSPPTTGITLGFDNSVAAGIGIHLANGLVPLVLSLEDWGEILLGEIYCISDAAGPQTVAAYEIILNET